MQELIKVDENKRLSARELYISLGLNKSQWSRWSNKNIIKDEFFKENVDYKGFALMSNGNEVQDFNITIEMAKHICMLARTEKAHILRKYFINIEKAWNSPEKVMQRALEYSKQAVERMEQQILLDEPYTNFAKAIAYSSGSISIGAFAKMLKNDGIDMGRNKLFKWLRKNDYVIKMGREKNNAKQRYVEQGLFELKESVVHTVKGDITTTTTLLTGKGQMYFLNKLN